MRIVAYKLHWDRRPAHRFSILYHKTANGRVPFLDWLNSIHDSVVSQRIEARLVRVLSGNLETFAWLETVCLR